jgi:ubiquinone/menaquinone biosynthesis C-methylase UbiE
MAEYDLEAPVYTLKRFVSRGGRYIDSTEKRLLASLAHGPSLLEIGTADGRFVSAVRDLGWNYTGLDISGQMLQHSRKYDCNLSRADGENIPFASSIFDSVICLHTFHFLPHPDQCIRESHRVLKQNGSILLIFEMDTWLRRLVLTTRIFRSNQFYFRIEEVAQMLDSNGFDVTGKGPVVKLPMDAYRKLPMTKFQQTIDRLERWPRLLATLGFVAGRKR